MLLRTDEHIKSSDVNDSSNSYEMNEFRVVLLGQLESGHETSRYQLYGIYERELEGIMRMVKTLKSRKGYSRFDGS